MVLVAVPVTLALTLFIYYAARLHPEPDHPVRADLLDRHPGGRRDRGGGEHLPPPADWADRTPAAAAVEGVDEVGNPTILATFTVIAAILPMAFVRGLMGPYMRPIPVGASAGDALLARRWRSS